MLSLASVRVNGQLVSYLDVPARLDGPDAGVARPVLVVLPAYTLPGDEVTIEFEYRGTALRQRGQSVFYVDERDFWYPRPDWMDPARFDARTVLHEPKKGDRAEIIATGRTTLEGHGHPGGRHYEGDPHYEVWTSDRDIFAAGFSHGRFFLESAPNWPVPTGVYVHDDAQAFYEELEAAVPPGGVETLRGFFEAAIGGRNPTGLKASELGLYDPRRLGQRILVETGEQLRVFVDLFGQFPLSHLAVFQFPVEFIEGWRSLLYVSSLPFLDSQQLVLYGLGGAFDPDAAEYARALRIARQWFGNAVRWKTYRDQWLIDGLAGYAGVLYLDRRYPDAGRGRAQLLALRNRLLASPGVDSEGETARLDDIGPVWLGERLESARTPGAYVGTVYTKSVWIMHMLRMLMRAPGAEDEDAAFFAMVREFIDTYDERLVTTAEFKEIAERYMNDSMDVEGTGNLDWFFDEWVYATGVPRYSVDYEVEEAPQGYFVSGRVEHSGVRDFIMPVPVYAVSPAEDAYYLGTLIVDDDGGDFAYFLQDPPAAFIVDPYDTVLKDN